MVEALLESRESIIRAVYPELRAMAARLLRRERDAHTLQRTALAHEALLRLFKNPPTLNLPRPEFLALAAHQMRIVLIDYARKHGARRRGGNLQRVPLFENEPFFERDEDELVALNQAVDRLAELHPRAASIVELKFFAGFKTDEIAAILRVSEGTIEAGWTFAKAWLHRELTKRPSGEARA